MPNSFYLPPIATVKDADTARTLAIDWQTWQGTESMSYGELAEYQGYFAELAQKFELAEEFQENGII